MWCQSIENSLPVEIESKVKTYENFNSNEFKRIGIVLCLEDSFILFRFYIVVASRDLSYLLVSITKKVRKVKRGD